MSERFLFLFFFLARELFLPPLEPPRWKETERGEEENGHSPDGITGSKTNPLRDRAVLFLGFGELLLGAEGFVGLCGEVRWDIVSWGFGVCLYFCGEGKRRIAMEKGIWRRVW